MVDLVAPLAQHTRSPRTGSNYGVLGLLGVAGAALAVLGWAESVLPLLYAGAASAAIVSILVAPELLLALFLAAGTIKGAPWLAALPFDLTLLAALGVIAAILGRLVRQRGPTKCLPPATVFMVGLASLVVLSVLWSPDPHGGLDKALRFQTFSLLAFLAPLLLLNSRSAFRRLMVGLVAFAVLIALTAVPGSGPEAPLVAAGGDEIQLGLNSSLALLAAVGYLLVIDRPLFRPLWFAAGIFLAGTVLAAGSRGALIGAALGLAYVWVRQVARSPRLWPLYAAATAVTIAAVAIAGPRLAGPSAEKYQNRLFSTELDAILGGRSYYLSKGWELSLDHPLGLGSGGFNAVTGLTHPHDLLLELSSEQGLLAVGIFVALAFASWRASTTSYRRSKSLEAIVAGGFIILLLAQASLSLGINDNRFLWFSFGLALALPRIALDR